MHGEAQDRRTEFKTILGYIVRHYLRAQKTKAEPKAKYWVMWERGDAGVCDMPRFQASRLDV